MQRQLLCTLSLITKAALDLSGLTTSTVVELEKIALWSTEKPVLRGNQIQEQGLENVKVQNKTYLCEPKTECQPLLIS